MSVKRKVITVVGARPQFVKAATVSKALLASQQAEETIVHTGQHYDYNMSESFFDQLAIPRPKYNLEIGSASHGRQTGAMLSKLDEILEIERPDCVLVYGDTNSTLAGALAAAKKAIPVAHVEAGLRSFNKFQPEEINRILTDQVASWCFAPTEIAVQNLRAMGRGADVVHLVGDVMYDAALHFASNAERKSIALQEHGLQNREYILTTIHRAENTDSPERLRSIIRLLCRLSFRIEVLLPLHPRTKNLLISQNLWEELAKSQVKLIEPLSFLDMIWLEKNARIVLTDSGGVQKEAFFFRVPCVTLRDETEWVETVQLGWNRLLPPGSACDAADIDQLLEAEPPPGNASEWNVFGDGRAAEHIVSELLGSMS
jgi:UDP-GlcNAc3NAcA epimerase